MIVKQIIFSLLIIAIIFFSLRVIYGLLAFMFRKNTVAMYVPSFNRHIRLMKGQLKLVRWKKLIDLWCGDGKMMRFFDREFWLQCDGYEIQYFPHLYGKILNMLLWYPDLKLLKKDFLLADIHAYDYIYTYLLPQQMVQIESRIFKNMKSDAIIISNSFQFALHAPYETIKNAKGKSSIFLYNKTDSK